MATLSHPPLAENHPDSFGVNHLRIPIDEIEENQILFYDLETDHQYAPYCELKMIGVQYGFNGKPHRVTSEGGRKKFKQKMEDPSVIKVGFNCLNFDNIVLHRNGIKVNENNCHDGYLMMKTIHPRMPSYSLKFLNWWILGDCHWPEFEMERFCKHEGINKWTGLPLKGKGTGRSIPNPFMEPYLNHDLFQHCNIFRYGWEIVQRPEHWDAYCLDLSQGEVVDEMELAGGIFVDKRTCVERIETLEARRKKLENYVDRETLGKVINPNSSKQVGAYLDAEGFELELTADGEFSVKKSDLVELKEKSWLARTTWVVRNINAVIKYYRNYLAAANHKPSSRNIVQIPTSFSISNAGTRRYTSNSFYKINFQNSDKHAKMIQAVPEGWLQFFIDSTQVENVVHIYESEDDDRRTDYETNEEWNEYVWLCNQILSGPPRDKWTLDHIPSEQIPNWSVYKQYKTCKLALNFGMGIGKFCETTGITRATGKALFNQIHEACPAIHKLQNKVRERLEKYGYVTDVFGHRYSDEPSRAYKCVAYLIQGCGTASLPKAQLRANFDTLKSHTIDGAFLSTTIHDETGGRISLDLGKDKILTILEELMYNMTTKFEHKFDNIPLRAKLYLSTTTAAQAKEMKLKDVKTYLENLK
jgi:hypothetical protein